MLEKMLQRCGVIVRRAEPQHVHARLHERAVEGFLRARHARGEGIAHRLARRVEAGYVWINTTGAHYLGVPFGGYKKSGIGREEGMDEVLAYTQVKNVHVML